MYLVDTNIISEYRKKTKAHFGVQKFFDNVSDHDLYISVITISELRRGVELIRHRSDNKQAIQLENWLDAIIQEHARNILDFTAVEAQIWGKLRVPHYENSIDKQIAATALAHDLTVVTRNVSDFSSTGVRILNPFQLEA